MRQGPRGTGRPQARPQDVYKRQVLHSPTVNYLFDEDDEEVVFVRQELDEEPAA